MRLKLLLPDVKSDKYPQPKRCSRPGCPGMNFYPRQFVQKKILDTEYDEVSAWRYQCTKCGCTFRVYPEGVNNQQISMRVLGMAVMLYILGLSYGAVEIVLGSLGIGIGKTSVYRAVQYAAQKVPGMKQKSLLAGYQTKAVGADVTSLRCNGKWVPIGISVDAVNGMVLSIDVLPGEDAEQLKAWLEPILDAVDADVLVTDDADGFKKVIEGLYLRYAKARKPGKGKKHDVAYRMRNLFMDRWNLWPRLTFYRTWKDEYGHKIIDGTNNNCERSIGWWIKERYRSMRGYKCEQSALNVSRLIAFAGSRLSRGLKLADLLA